MSDRVITPLIALGLAVLVWLYMRSRDQEIIEKEAIAVELRLAAGQAGSYELERIGPGHVPASFTGPPSRIRELRQLLQRGELVVERTVSVPEERLADARYAGEIRIDPREVPVPPGVVAVIPENQNHIAFTLRKVVEKRLPILLRHNGGDAVEQVVLEPATVRVRGPKELLDREDAWPTQLYSLPNRKGATEPLVLNSPVAVPLARELSGRSIEVEPAAVAVQLILRPPEKVHELLEVPVQFLCPPNFPYRPEFTSERDGKVSLRVRGPAREERPNVTVYVDLTARKFGPGLHADEPVRVQLPPGVQLAQEAPRLSFKLLPVERTAAAP